MDSKKNGKNKKAVDVSAFFIFEATGDSEADQFVADPNKAAATGRRRDYGDDAESCSQGDDDDDDCHESNFPFGTGVNWRRAHYNDNVQVCIDYDDGEEEEGEEAHSYYPPWPHHQNGSKKSREAVDSSSHEEFASEMEKNKQFWDSCLAS